MARSTSACRFRDGRRTASRSRFSRPDPSRASPGRRSSSFPSNGGEVKQLTTAPSGVQQLAWSPDGATIGFATADVPEKKPGYQRWNDSFEVQLNFHLFMTAPVPPTHVWTVPVSGGDAKRLTSGEWTLPVTRPPGAPSSMITWTPDGSAIVFARSGGGVPGGLQSVSVADGTIKPLDLGGTFPVYSREGRSDCVPEQRRGRRRLSAVGRRRTSRSPSIAASLARSGCPTASRSSSAPMTRNASRSGSSRSTGAAKKLDTGDVSPNSSFFVDMAVSSTGAIAFTGTSPTRPGELYLKASPEAPVKRLTGVNDEIASLPLGRVGSRELHVREVRAERHPDVSAGFRSLEEIPARAADSWRPACGVADDLQRRRAVDGREGLAGVSAELPWQRQSRPRSFRVRFRTTPAPARAATSWPASMPSSTAGIVDDSRMAVSGWSYGGYMTTWMLGNYPNVMEGGGRGRGRDRSDRSAELQ